MLSSIGSTRLVFGSHHALIPIDLHILNLRWRRARALHLPYRLPPLRLLALLALLRVLVIMRLLEHLSTRLITIA